VGEAGAKSREKVEHGRDQVAGREYCRKPTELGSALSRRKHNKRGDNITVHCHKNKRNFSSPTEISKLFREHSIINISENYSPLYLLMPLSISNFSASTFRDLC
jgi:hypothetical protein